MRRIVLAILCVVAWLAPMHALAEEGSASLDLSVTLWRKQTNSEQFGWKGECLVGVHPKDSYGEAIRVSTGSPGQPRQPAIVIRDETGVIIDFWQVSGATLEKEGSAVRCAVRHTFTLSTSHPYYVVYVDTEMVHMFASSAPTDPVSIQFPTEEGTPVR